MGGIPRIMCCYIALFVISMVTVLAGALNRNDTSEAKLFSRLFGTPENVSKYLRPVANPQEAVQIRVSIAVIGLENLDEKRQVLSTHVWLRQKWTDPFLRWSAEDYDNIRLLMVPSDHIWTPDLVPHNSVSDLYSHHHDSLAKVSYTGEVLWITQARVDTFCHIDLTEFPYDEHNCTIKYGSWAYDAYKVNLSHWDTPELDLDYGSPTRHQTWEVISGDVTIHTEVYGCCPEPYQDVTASLRVRRRTTYVTHVFIAPAVMFVLLVPAVFMLPADSSNKFILGTGILLALVLLLLMLEEFLQGAYSTVPRLGLYYLSILVLVSFSMGVSAFVANLWNRSRRRSVSVPGVVRVIVLKGLGRLLCVQYEDFLSSEPLADPDTDTISTNIDTVSNNSMNPLDGAKMIREYNSQVVNRAEWRQLAAIMDRVFCLVFFVVSILIATAILIKF